MLRFAYNWILRLHPRRFRRCFADEMLWIFDQSQGIPGTVKLLQDGFFSLARQWTLRSEYWEEGEDSASTPPLSLDGIPLFHSLESPKPRAAALLQGGVFSIVAFYVILLALKYSWNHPVFVQFSGIQFEATSDDVPSDSPERLSSDANEKGSAHLAISRASRRAHPKAISSVPGKFAVVEAHTPESTSGTGFPPGVDNSTKPTVPIVSPPSVQSFSPSVTPSAVLRSYAGTYVAGPPNEIEVSITFEDGKLAIEVPGEPKNRLVAMSATRFTIAGSTNDWIDFKSQGYPIGSQANISLSGRHLVVHRKFY